MFERPHQHTNVIDTNNSNCIDVGKVCVEAPAPPLTPAGSNGFICTPLHLISKTRHPNKATPVFTDTDNRHWQQTLMSDSQEFSDHFKSQR